MGCTSYWFSGSLSLFHLFRTQSCNGLFAFLSAAAYRMGCVLGLLMQKDWGTTMQLSSQFLNRPVWSQLTIELLLLISNFTAFWSINVICIITNTRFVKISFMTVPWFFKKRFVYPVVCRITYILVPAS